RCPHPGDPPARRRHRSPRPAARTAPERPHHSIEPSPAMMPTLMSRFGVLSLFCLLSACQTFEDGDKRLYEQSNRLFEESLEQSQRKVAPPASVQAGLIPPLTMSDNRLATGPRFDVAVSDMPAREFFLSLMDSAGENLLVHPGVTGNVTFSLRNVTLDE